MNKISLCGDLNTSLIVYATFFLTLGMALSFVHIPQKYKSENYRTSISMFGCAYLLFIRIVGHFHTIPFPTLRLGKRL